MGTGKWSGIGDWLARQAARLRAQDGQALADYSLILVFIAIAALAALIFLGTAITDEFTTFSGCLADPTGCI